jgi:integrative and conjugative element protein (TIGR02256 family)
MANLSVHVDVLDQLLELPSRPYEVGGWLLGYWTADREQVMVTHATPPARRGTPFGITIDGRGHRPRFDEAWDASEGLVTFLGDWHTHPGGPPIPSWRDQRAARRLATNEDFRTQHPLVAIVSVPRLPAARGFRGVRWYIGDAGEPLSELAARSARTLPDRAQAVPCWPWPKARRRGQLTSSATLARAPSTSPASASTRPPASAVRRAAVV